MIPVPRGGGGGDGDAGGAESAASSSALDSFEVTAAVLSSFRNPDRSTGASGCSFALSI